MGSRELECALLSLAGRESVAALHQEGIRVEFAYGLAQQPYGIERVVVQLCPHCQKKFTRTKNESKLNVHKNEWGGQCSSRTGYLIDTR